MVDQIAPTLQLALAAPQTVWALYTGAISYVLMAIVFAVEYLVRKARFGRYGTGFLDRVLARVLGNGSVSS